ncbi:MAG: CPBP family intramembrane metalloprotease [Deltaproteobacteria bacterium]|nr:CPBP family intramembrane metalloprotease [Deltaproteobacteria bacterium]
MPFWLAPSSYELPFVGGLPGALLKMALPAVVFAATAPVFYWFFQKTWRELDAEAMEYRLEQRDSGAFDMRPWAMFAIVAVVLTAQEYYGGSRFFGAYLRPHLADFEQVRQRAHVPTWVDTRFYGELYGYGWWALCRVFGYTIFPMAVWKLLFPKDSLLDMGLRTKGLLSHAWIYGVCLAVVLPCVYLASRSPDFASYYPFYKGATRSWLDLLVWETMYIAQFFALEVFFRGFMLSPLRRSFGSGAVFAMCVPYVMIHYGKPYLESAGAFLAGVALGSLAMRTRSIYSGFFVHVSVALMMDLLALARGAGLPSQFWPR